ncbi:synaptonemal complex central element protein 2 [Nelusetta ayraudi]|uniref:synaptonemal complex central element protein 2 n=1 Tax=Nelusetta ayraudi TaxID=303726 RepID=UPI003F703C68
MEFFFDDEMSIRHSTSKSGRNQMTQTENPEQSVTRENSSCLNRTQIQEEPTSSSVEDISKRAQDLVEKINESRTNDQKVMENFQGQLMEKVTEVCQQMKENMYTVYEENSNEMQVKLQELTEVLESCNKLIKELMEASQALAGLRADLASRSMPEH